MADILFWDSNDIAHQGAWFYAGVLEAALEIAVQYLEEAEIDEAIVDINNYLDEENEHMYTPKEE